MGTGAGLEVYLGAGVEERFWALSRWDRELRYVWRLVRLVGTGCAVLIEYYDLLLG